ncbi:hypothetical protein [Streptomyces sp. SID3343]|uniref:hypothetical protein n=1 Tax=Streptomyces sp. SID3343 TaxID=2690260 RepID=UPI00136F6289|nr:hypothetical protein [Streptomyces sp. SID3343]MYW05612.1 hypothetical protein [Streptomyces sp. SID3343]
MGDKDGDGFVADATYLRDSARELSEAMFPMRQVAQQRDELMSRLQQLGTQWPSFAQQSQNILDETTKIMAAAVAKGESLAIGLLTAAEGYDEADRAAQEAVTPPGGPPAPPASTPDPKETSGPPAPTSDPEETLPTPTPGKSPEPSR